MEIVPPKITIKAKDGKESLALSVYSGTVGLAVWGGQQGGPLFKHTLNPDKRSLVKHHLRKAKEAQPETKFPMIIQKWDADNRKFIKEAVITIGKDEKQVVYIEISFKSGDSGKTLRFDLKMSGGVSLGDEPMADSTKSIFKVNALLEWFEEMVPVACVLTGKKGQFGGNKSGGGGYNNNRSNSSGGASDFGSSNSGGDNVFG